MPSRRESRLNRGDAKEVSAAGLETMARVAKWCGFAKFNTTDKVAPDGKSLGCIRTCPGSPGVAHGSTGSTKARLGASTPTMGGGLGL